jgi:hypothetical protein
MSALLFNVIEPIDSDEQPVQSGDFVVYRNCKVFEAGAVKKSKTKRKERTNMMRRTDADMKAGVWKR